MGSKGDLSKVDEQLASLASAVGEEKVKQQRGMVRRIWSAMGLVGHLFFRNTKEDFEKRLQHLSKEEVAVHNRLKRRTQLWRKFARNIILYSVIGEILILGIAIYSTRNAFMTWQTRAWRVFPVFALPLITSLVYSSCGGFFRMRERKDQKTLEKLRTERKEKIDELKEKTNYYLTQQLIQKYDMDPAAKAAAASVLASKLGSESGLKFALQAADMLEADEAAGKSPTSGRKNDKDGADASGLRNRRAVSRKLSQVDPRPSMVQNSQQARYNERAEVSPYRVVGEVMEDEDAWEHRKEVEHHRGKPSEGGWIARLAAMLVGEDPSQCYALICAKCHMHNGLAKKEDYQYITYYCPHCHALNKSNQLDGGDGNHQSKGGASSPTKPLPGPEEVFSTSGGSLSPATQDALSNSALAISSALADPRGEPIIELDSDNNLSDN